MSNWKETHKSPAEELLVEAGVVKRRTPQRRAVIGCIGCKWLGARETGSEPKVYAYQIVKCTGLGAATIKATIKPLIDSAIIHSEREKDNPANPAYPPRNYLHPTDTDLGQAFFERLETPETCPLEKVAPIE